MTSKFTKSAVDAYIRDQLSAAHKRKQSFRKLGIRYGMSHVQVQHVVSGRSGVGQSVEQTWADKHFEGSIDKLRSTAEAWAKANGLWGVSLTADAAGWIDTAPIKNERLRTALKVAVDEGVADALLRSFVERHDKTKLSYRTLEWWNLIQAEAISERTHSKSLRNAPTTMSHRSVVPDKETASPVEPVHANVTSSSGGGPSERTPSTPPVAAARAHLAKRRLAKGKRPSIDPR